MHARWSIEIAALWALHHDVICKTQKDVSRQSLNAYWVASRGRAEAWSEALHEGRSQLEGSGAHRRLSAWRQLQCTLEEILISEPLTRIMAAVTTMADQSNHQSELSPITNSVHIAHLEARHRSLQLLVGGFGLPVEQAVQLNRLRHHAEEWTDLLLAHLVPCPCLETFCFDQEKLRSFSEDIVDERSTWPSACGGSTCGVAAGPSHGPIRRGLLLTGLRRWVREYSTSRPANARFNRAIGQASLGLLGHECFDSFGEMRSPASFRFSQVIEETNGQVKDGRGTIPGSTDDLAPFVSRSKHIPKPTNRLPPDAAFE